MAEIPLLQNGCTAGDIIDTINAIIATLNDGSSLTVSYDDLENKPYINGVELKGNKDTSALLIAMSGTTDYDTLMETLATKAYADGVKNQVVEAVEGVAENAIESKLDKDLSNVETVDAFSSESFVLISTSSGAKKVKLKDLALKQTTANDPKCTGCGANNVNVNFGAHGMVLRNTTAFWDAKSGFMPLEGQIIIYSDYAVTERDGEQVDIPNIKIGTGKDFVQDLPFLGQAEKEAVALLMDDAGDKHFSYEWQELSTAVEVQHNLHKKPSVTTVDTAGNELFCDVIYKDDDNVVLQFSEPVRGTAYFN